MTESKDIDINYLQACLQSATEDVESTLVNISNTSVMRNKTRKALLKGEFEQLVNKLNVNDADTVRLLRAEIMQSLLLYKMEANRILTRLKVKNVESKDALFQLKKFHEQLFRLQSLKYYCNLEIGNDLETFRSVSEQSIFVRSKLLNPKGFRLSIEVQPRLSTNAIAVIECIDNNQSFRDEFVNSSMEITHNAIHSNDNNVSLFPLFRSSLSNLLNQEKACLMSNFKVVLNLDPSPTAVSMLVVKVLGVNIIDSGAKTFSIILSEKGETNLSMNDTSSIIKPIDCETFSTRPDSTIGFVHSTERLKDNFNDESSVEIINESKKNEMISSKLGLVCDFCLDKSCYDVSRYKKQSLDRSVLQNGITNNIELVRINEAHDTTLEISTSWVYNKSNKIRLKDASLETLVGYPTKMIAESCTRTLKCLERPLYLSVDSSEEYSCVLVSETSKDRIGVYDAVTFGFIGWFSAQGYKQIQPTNVLTIGNYVVVLNHNGINLFLRGNGVLELFYKYYWTGSYRGLVGCHEEMIFWTIDDSFRIREFKIDQDEDTLEEMNKEEEILIDNSDSDRSGLNVEQFVFHDNKFYIASKTNKLIIIARKTREQTWLDLQTIGSHRINPSGLVVDEAGYFLLCDQLSNKLMIFNPEGKQTKGVSIDNDDQITSEMVSPCAIECHADTVLVVFSGKDNSGAGVIRYRISGDSVGIADETEAAGGVDNEVQ